MNLKIFNQLPFYKALQAFFVQLNIPVNYIAEEPTTAKSILTNTFKENNASFTSIKDVYFLGMVDQTAFDEEKSKETLATLKKGKKDYDGLLIFGVILKNNNTTRTQIAEITRAFNREFHYTPVVVIFKYADYISFSASERVAFKQEWREGERVGKISMLKDIYIPKPHAGHLRILNDMQINPLLVSSFEELNIHWKKVYSVQVLNDNFFTELSNWYFWAQQYVEFPNDKKIENDKNVQLNLIRLITRMIFVWFLKEKKLVPTNLFEKPFIKEKLKSFDPENKNSKSYYQAILQNLFFATLNQKMNDREFIVEGSFKENKDQYGVKNLYRYASLFAINEKEIINLFKDIPFLNGGLFECLDKENEETKKVEYIDGFSRNAKKTPLIPDILFFGKERMEDLSEEYGYKMQQRKCSGLFEIFNSYKFTIQENTPIEEEIALDPELLGKVFENLLAYYNPETATTARKQTGSFYTPREIVNYMVDESLIAYLKTKMLEPKSSWLQIGNSQTELFGNATRKGQLKMEQSLENNTWIEKEEELENNLRKLVSYNNEQHSFINEQEIQHLIYAIDHCKILDPACGSGAFPVGVLHKLVYVLGRLDKDNARWHKLQQNKAQKEIEKALNDIDKKEREKKLIDINESFENNASDFGRKLYLIENCIYGVDLQPIAVQISKLRFFISLVVDQYENKDADNLGIRPLPNLETKFVAANTLIGLDKPEQLPIGYELIYPLQEQLQQIRHNHFEAKNRKDKLKYQKQDKTIRRKIADKLIDIGFGNKDAEKVASFDLYDQNIASTWFEPEWMFGNDLAKGFDIVIGNPPYVDSETMTRDNPQFRELLKSKFKCAVGNWDLFVVFVEKGINLCKQNGHLTFIVPNKLISAKYTYSIREYLNTKSIKELIDYSYVEVFKEADVYPIVFNIQNSKPLNHNVITKVMASLEDLKNVNLIPSSLFCKDIFWDKYFFDENILSIVVKLTQNNQKLKNEFPSIYGAATVGEAYEIKDKIKEINKDKKKFMFINTGTIDPYTSLWGIKPTQYIKGSYSKPVITCDDLKEISSTRFTQSNAAKIIIAGMALRIEAFYDVGEYCAGKSTTIILGDSLKLKSLTGILNSKLVSFWFSKYFNSLSMAGGYFNIGNNEIGLIPLPNTNFPVISINTIVDKIISAKAQNPKADIGSLENQLDVMVYKLYNLTYDEILVVDTIFENQMSRKEYDKLNYGFEYKALPIAELTINTSTQTKKGRKRINTEGFGALGDLL